MHPNSSRRVHVVVTVKGSRMRLYKDGLLVVERLDNSGGNPRLATRDAHSVGKAFENSGFWDGEIAFLHVWDDYEVHEPYAEQLFLDNGYATPEPTSLPTMQPTVTDAPIFAGNLTQYVLKKYKDQMGPILCSATQCWLRAGGAFDQNEGDDTLGAHFFPLIQNTDERCLSCDTAFSKRGSRSDVCNEVDLEYLLYFDPSAPHLPAALSYNRSDFKRFDEQNSGVDGLFYLNMYWGVEFLNEYSYVVPDLHCTRPV